MHHPPKSFHARYAGESKKTIYINLKIFLHHRNRPLLPKAAAAKKLSSPPNRNDNRRDSVSVRYWNVFSKIPPPMLSRDTKVPKATKILSTGSFTSDSFVVDTTASVHHPLFIQVTVREPSLPVPDNCTPYSEQHRKLPSSLVASFDPEVNLLFSITLRLSSTATSGSVHYTDAPVSSFPCDARRLKDRASSERKWNRTTTPWFREATVETLAPFSKWFVVDRTGNCNEVVNFGFNDHEWSKDFAISRGMPALWILLK